MIQPIETFDDLVKLQFTDIFGQCKMVQMTRMQAEKAMKEGYAINRFALGGLQKPGLRARRRRSI